MLAEGVTPTTAQVNLLHYGSAPARVERSPPSAPIAAPVEFLRDIHVVDTPGTNAVIREHEAITADFLPRSDLVLFRDLGRSTVHRKRAPVPGDDPGVGQEGRHRPQQDRLVRLRHRAGDGAGVHRSPRAPGAARLGARDLSGERASGTARQTRRANGVGRQPVRGSRTLHASAARRARTPEAEAGQPARRGPCDGQTGIWTWFRGGWTCCRRT